MSEHDSFAAYEGLAAAVSAYEAGRLGQAVAQCEKLLAEDPGNASALNVLGMINHELGHHRRAVDLMCKSVAIRPNAPLVCANLAKAYRALEDPRRAEGCCRLALAMRPDCLEAICNLGLACKIPVAPRKPPINSVRHCNHGPTLAPCTTISEWSSCN